MEKKGRFDFSIEVLSTDNNTRTVQFCARPDPRRYDSVTIDGVPYYRDRYLETLIAGEEMAREMSGLPIFHLQPSIKSAPEYALARKQAAVQELSGHGHTPPPERATQHQEYSDSLRDIAFLSVDICGATAHRRRDAAGFERAYDLFLKELGTLVGQFNASILKTTGDGFIAYIDHPSFTSQCDATVDLGLSLLVLLRDAVNPALAMVDLAPLSIRIGADYGPSTTRKVLIPSTNFQAMEVASDALNRAVKIQESCEPGTLRIGRELYELVHVQWLERAAPVQFDHRAVGIDNYRVYEIR
ncbi:conserved hypothetical protein [Cupriavidus taiwanensis]|uniref:hypothetical protein n=1 Tax=Cupriavidus taiwanensis TaxID=164546 RepID=UPI000E1445F3|nr:hypothetical protein [Cupriavidus taiwanensis]SPA21981.1 conserved hypothetical protein [Cupriavidus taiwanensis]